LDNLGESIQDVFDSLQINDPRLQAWNQVHAAIKLIGNKLQEKKALEDRIQALIQEVESVRNLASELVSSAYRSEQEVHETSRLRMQVAESLSDKLVAALKA
jgi:DNA repair ATPase RecN